MQLLNDIARFHIREYLRISTVQYQGNAHVWISFHPSASWDFEFPEKTETVLIALLTRSNKQGCAINATSRGRSSATNGPITAMFASWCLFMRTFSYLSNGFLMHNTNTKDPMPATLQDLWHGCTMHPSHWPQCLYRLLRVSSGLLRYFSRAFASRLLCSLASGPHISFEHPIRNHSWRHINVTWHVTYHRTVQCAAIPNIVGNATRAWYAMNKLH